MNVLLLLLFFPAVIDASKKFISFVPSSNTFVAEGSDDIITIGDSVFIFSDTDSINSSSNDIVKSSAYSWGLDRVDYPLDKANYLPAFKGDGVKVFVFDSGILENHNEFSSPVTHLHSDYGNYEDESCHGTHVSSTVAGRTVGVAPGVKLFNIRILDKRNQGQMSGIIRGLSRALKELNGERGIASMSLIGSKNVVVNRAIDEAYKLGLVSVVAAGNNHRDACEYSPASAETAITVGAIDKDDSVADYSNYGSCVDIYAPGTSIVGASCHDTAEFRTLTGTSMACPHVTGVLAQLFQKNRRENVGYSVRELMNTAATIDSGELLVRVYKRTPTSRPTRRLRTRRPTRAPTSRPTRRLRTRRPTRAPTPRPTRLSPWVQCAMILEADKCTFDKHNCAWVKNCNGNRHCRLVEWED